MHSLTENEVRILKRLRTYGKPVRQTKLGVELSGGEFLCRGQELRQLFTKELVEKTAEGYYQMSPNGESAIAELL